MIIRPGQVIDGIGETPLAGVEVVVRDGAIAAVQAVESASCDGEDVVEAAGATLMPGMADLHMHIFNKNQPQERPKPPESVMEMALRGVANAADLVEIGVTTVRDVGSRGNYAIELRDLISGGAIPGPRFFASGNAISVVGRAYYYSPGTQVSGADEMQAATRMQLRAGADWIKVMATAGVGGGTGMLVGEPGWQEFTEAELSAAATEVHMARRKITAHAIGTNGIKAAIRAGVDCIEHGSYLDDEGIELMLANDVSMVPTLIITHNLAVHGAERGFPLNVIERAKQTYEFALEAVGRAHSAGVRIGVGSDVDFDETAAQEVRMLVGAGLSPMDAIKAATANAAAILDIDDEVGTVEAGKVADLILVDGDPITDPLVLDRVTHVIQGGAVVKAPLA